ncbi:PREDICTED: cation/H(+) antiporter 15-like [Nelumbo nucifera]|uniref:Cation/H(+) antiporter 15-like n=2 Tax=Nelumbo nucifera TaxID=4432 RepID=A0A1U8Q4E2_NELNU|nr:PREDICTED: cation/H(+) antiporter 15-like [Nelumbo nucifera]
MYECYNLMKGGIILGPSALGRSERFNQIVFPEKAMFILNTMAVMGIVYFIFLIGVKMDKNLILNPRKKAYRIGAISLVVPFVLVGFMSYLLQRPLAGLVQGHFFLFLAASLSITAFPVLALALEELNLLTSELGKLAMSSSMINDMIGWFFMGLFVALHQRNSINSLRAIASTTLLITFITHVLRPCIILIDKITPAGRLVDRVYVVAILITVLFLSLLSNMVGASAVDAPLVLGIVIPEGSPLGASIVERTETVVGQILLPLFFVRCGLAVDVFKIADMTAFAALEFVVFMGYVGKLAATVLISLYCGVSIRHSLSLGLIMNIRGLVEVITFIHWRSQKVIPNSQINRWN